MPHRARVAELADAGLKALALRACGFESHPGHLDPFGRVSLAKTCFAR